MYLNSQWIVIEHTKHGELNTMRCSTSGLQIFPHIVMESPVDWICLFWGPCEGDNVVEGSLRLNEGLYVDMPTGHLDKWVDVTLLC